ncbi:MAG: hypothetical protein IJM79_00745 [Erysipelotrichaceae bacterium]|nr:hypothetical protein [Erysipelotrichaceae bacterium]
MEKITSFAFALDALKQCEVLCSRSGGSLTRYRLKGDRISVSGENAHYTLSIKEFAELFARETFYIYDQFQPTIDTEKDDEYYAWKNRSTN